MTTKIDFVNTGIKKINPKPPRSRKKGSASLSMAAEVRAG